MSSTPPPDPAVEVTRVDVRRAWPFVLGVGIVSLLAGLITLVWPSATVLALVIVLGVFLLIAGVTEIGWAIAERDTEGWGMILFRGIVDVVAGIVVLVWPAATALVLALLLAAWLLVYAAMTFWYAYRHRGERPHTGHFVAKGVVATIAAVITIVWPSITILVIALIVGIALLIKGVLLIRFAFILRRQPAV
jgi:uncharacterized membrane protein HdeD (DUF308 family)